MSTTVNNNSRHYSFGADDSGFPKYFTLDNLLDKAELHQLWEKLGIENLNFEQSVVYNTVTSENIIKEDLRKSARAVIPSKDDTFLLVDEMIVSKINTHKQSADNEDSGARFFLVRDELEVVKYKPGEYFHKHHDYVQVTSKFVKCYTLLLCLVGGCTGGSTILYFPPVDVESTSESATKDHTIESTPNDDVVKVTQTTVPGSALVMRNELVHEGEEVKEGEKLVLKINLWAVPTASEIKKPEDDVIVVDFDNPKEAHYIVPVQFVLKYPKSMLYHCYRKLSLFSGTTANSNNQQPTTNTNNQQPTSPPPPLPSPSPPTHLNGHYLA